MQVNESGGSNSGAPQDPGSPANPKPSTAPTFTYEYLVDQEYSGALRFGLSGILVGGDNAYVIRKAPGATIGTIVDNGTSPFDAEVVVGYAPFVFDWIWGKDRARRYSTWPHGSNIAVAPYLGLGLISGSNSGVTWLRSLYLGIEYEFSPNFSVAGTWVLRRVNRLADGLTLGDPVTDGTVLTKTAYSLSGVGLVINFTPDFAKFATGIGAPK
jgi:hypothetical protein